MGDIVFQVWGSRGSIFAGGSDKTEFGGDTTCFSLSNGTGMAIVDAGSGLHALGRAMEAGDVHPYVEIDLLLTHLHFDHICGLPFFEPIFSDKTVLRIWSASFDRDEAFRETLSRVMSPPIFPHFRHWESVRLCTAQTGIAIPLAMGGTATPFALHHPDGACGWRIDSGGRSATIASDHESGNAMIDARIAQAAQGTDLLVCDAMYTDAEIGMRRGWGHSTWRQGVELGSQAGAQHLLMTHHDPRRGDEDVALMEREARAHNPNVTFARSGWRRTL
jgi:phosphoribosyl 1,2-cyclic phosphodiesterase